MGMILAFLGGGLSLLNFSLEWRSLPLQVVFTIISLLSMIIYNGKKTRKSYAGDGTRIFTFGFAVCFISFIGSASILLAIFMGWQ
ncbi:hypothetical protein [Lactococcus garvieae]|uniref:hypothetical protein n=1 Tax=Lactococcus garvieae TaxID=1363 RepID=UPI0002F878C1|nr:hypothetical protein [Lactococcus garvieae]